MASKLTEKYAFIDAMRGLAFLGVLVFHASTWVEGLGGPAKKLAAQGNEGVQLFFVVSALTMFLSMDSRRGEERRPTRNFFLRRFFRIAPLFYFAAAYSVLFGHRLTGDPRFDAGALLSTATFLHSWTVDWNNFLVPGGWTIGVEMNFYLLVPLLYHLIRTPERAGWATMMSLLIAGLATAAADVGLTAVLGADRAGDVHRFTYYWLPTQLPIFCGGFCLYFLVRPVLRGESPASPRRGRATLLLIASVYLIIALSFSQAKLLLGHALFGLAFVMLGWSLAMHPNRLLVNPITRRLGIISFSGYVTHFTALEVVGDGLARLGPRFEALPALARLGLMVSLGTLLTAAIASVTYRFIEVPGQAFGRRLIRALERAEDTGQTPATAGIGSSAVDPSTLAPARAGMY